VAFCVIAPCAQAATYSVRVEPGYNSIANHLDRGANRLDDVIPNPPHGSQLWKFNRATQNYYEPAIFLDDEWHSFVPEMERLNPGEGAFLWVARSATLTFTGAIAQFSLPRPATFGGYNFVSAHRPRNMSFVELFDFAPHPGDIVYLYDKPFAALPQANQQYYSSIHRFTPQGWDIVPTFRVGRSAFVYLSDGPGARIVQQPPVSQIVSSGQTVRFDVSVVGPGPYQYQWLFNEDELPGETNSFLSIKNVQYWHNGLYSVTVRNPYGEATSRLGFLRVNSKPVILDQPKPIQAVPGRKVEFRVRAVGNPVLRYQWFYNNRIMTNETEPVLVIEKPEQ
jgi:Ig-like domain-containing protein